MWYFMLKELYICFPLKEKALVFWLTYLSDLLTRRLGAAFSFTKSWELALILQGFKSGKELVHFGS